MAFSTLLTLVNEIKTDPAGALALVKALQKVCKPWESLTSASNELSEMTVPAGQSAKDFMKNASKGFVSGYRINTIFGEEVALVTKDHPRWKVLIEGQNQSDSPIIGNSKTSEATVRAFVEEKLVERGYIVG